MEETEDYAKWIDNGIYIIDGWDISKRISPSDVKEGYDLNEMLLQIDKAQPESEQLGEGFIMAEEVDVSELEIGDKVYIQKYEAKPEIHTVVGIANNLPYVDLYDHDGDYSWNCNNYLQGKVRVYKKGEEA